MNPKVEFYFNQESWQEETRLLRKIALSCGLTEELKWGTPCYLYHGSNIVLIHVFKEYCALLFFKGALLANPDGVLIQQTANVQAARQVRFTSAKEIVALEQRLRSIIFEAIEIEKAGLKVVLKKTHEFPMPEEFQNSLTANPQLKTAFEALTPGRQRAYLLHFSAPKQTQTRLSRIEKCSPQILNGKGLNDK